MMNDGAVLVDVLAVIVGVSVLSFDVVVLVQHQHKWGREVPGVGPDIIESYSKKPVELIRETVNVVQRRAIDEHERRASIETKMSILVGFDAILIGLLIQTSTISITQWIGLVTITAAVVIGFVALYIYPYKTPAPDEPIHEFYREFTRSQVLVDQLERQTSTVQRNTAINTYRNRLYRLILLNTATAVVLLVLERLVIGFPQLG